MFYFEWMMLHILLLIKFFHKHGIICIILIGFLKVYNPSQSLVSEAFISSGKPALSSLIGLRSQHGLPHRTHDFKASSLDTPVDRGSSYTRVSHEPESEFLRNCMARSMISQTTDFLKLDRLFADYEKTNFNNAMRASVYYGIDCTNDFIHEGTLLQLMLLRKFLSHGFNVVLVLGGGTTLVGDPSYKLRKTRQDPYYFADLIEPGNRAVFDTRMEEAIYDIATKILSLPLQVNGEPVTPKVNRITHLHSDLALCSEMCNPYRVFVFNNRDLYRRVSLMEYLQVVARNMNVGRMLARDCIKMRVVDKDREDGRRSVNLDLSELMYMSLQALDFVYLAQKLNCKIQLGGNDQMGNILSGIELAESLGLGTLFGITTPLLEDKFGEKISKSGSNCFLKITKNTSPHELWSHFRSVEDNTVERYLSNLYIKWFTGVPLEKMHESISDHYNTGKMLLADELTAQIYGRQVVELIHRFCLSKKFEDLAPFMCDSEVELGEFESFVNFTKSVPHLELSSQDLEKGVDLLEVLDTVRVPQFSNAAFHSNKKFVREGACLLNGRVVEDTGYKLSEKDVVNLKSGENRHRYIAIQLGNRKLYFVNVV